MVNVNQVKQIVRDYLNASGRGGFLTGTVISTAPITIKLETGLQVIADDLYITEGCIGLQLNLKHNHGGGDDALVDKVQLYSPLQVGHGVLLLSRPALLDGTKYILLGRIQPYTSVREVTTT